MSLILDALNRSRTEAEPVPGLASEPLFLPENESKWVARLPWIALFVALLLIVWLVGDRVFNAPVADAEAVPSSTMEAASGDVAKIKPKPKPKPKQIVDPVLADSGTTAVSANKEPIPRAAATAPVTEPPAAVPAAKTPAKDIERLYAAPRVTAKANAKPVASRKPLAGKKPLAKQASTPANKAKPVEVNSEADIDKMLQMAERERRSDALEEHDAPMVAALSQPKKDSIPTLIYDRHDYNSAAPGRSSVVINGKTLRKGGTAARGVKVDEILSDSVVLKHQGGQFRLRALNSWVNL